MTIFLLFPFSRLVHVWSGFATIGVLLRPHQVVRSRRLNVAAGSDMPGQPAATPPRSVAASGALSRSPKGPAVPVVARVKERPL